MEKALKKREAQAVVIEEMRGHFIYCLGVRLLMSICQKPSSI